MINLKDKSPKILVIGDLMVDHYIWGSCDRISPEAPVQIVKVEQESSSLGGAGNVVSNLKALGADVDVISVIGDCNVSIELQNLLTNINVDTSQLITQSGRLASKKNRIISSHQQVVRFDQESIDEISDESQQKILKQFITVIENYEIILFSDYGKGLFTKDLSQSLIKYAKNHNKKVLIDPKGMDYSKYQGAYLLTPNKKEASEATKIDIHDDATLMRAIKQLKLDCNLSISLITLSESGIGIYDDNLRIHPTYTREIFDVTGAGDTVLSSLGFALACDLDIDSAVEFSNLSAGVVVGKVGSSTATLNEIIEYESSINQSTSDKHIKSFTEIGELSSELKSKDRKIVFTNGCFDILHSGHVKYLEEAKKFGDILIVGLNSDSSVSALKGESRPINNELDRSYILAAIEVVDYVVIFNDETPYKLINIIKPDTLVKGGDYKDTEIIGADIVNELQLINFIDGKSTTKIIDKIQQNS
jgi:D-beta-D-heptose 7-phosphate kinase / D-beta-D-heptose 1-phosphate adenosyltransferase